jgi:hypothetical protein
MLIELHADSGLPLFDAFLFNKRTGVVGAGLDGVGLVAFFRRAQIG